MMNHWQRLGLPVALGICAAFLNWRSVSRQLTPRDYVAAKSNITAGEKLGQESFTRVSISHSTNAELEQALVPWNKVSALVGRFALRSIASGAPLTQFDICEANVATRNGEEDEIELRMSFGERENSALFVNDLVDLRYQGVRALFGCRILSIVRDKEDYQIRLAVDPNQLRILERRSDFSPRDLRIFGHFQPKKQVKS